MRERTGDEGSGAASWKLEESAEAFTFRLRKEEEKKKKRRRNYSKRNNELLIHRRQKAGVRIAFDVSLSFSLCTILSRRRRRRGRRIVFDGKWKGRSSQGRFYAEMRLPRGKESRGRNGREGGGMGTGVPR